MKIKEYKKASDLVLKIVLVIAFLFGSIINTVDNKYQPYLNL